MLKKFLRSSPWWMQLMILTLLVLISLSIFWAVQYFLIPKMFGYPLEDVAQVSDTSPNSLIQAALTSQLISHLSTFLIPSAVFAYLVTPYPKDYLGLRPPGRRVDWLLVTALMLSIIPLFLYLETLLRQIIPISSGFEAVQNTNDRLMKAFLKMDNLGTFLLSFLVMAITPALGEEFMFRGIAMRFAAKARLGIRFAIMLSALLFTGMHPNPIGWLPIFIAGVLLGLIYYWTGSLWLSILAHFINNGTQVLMVAYAERHPLLKKMVEATEVPIGYALLSIALSALFLYLLYKNRTPLTSNWFDDYKTPDSSFEQV